MANIPTIPGTSEVQDQSIGVKVDPTLGLQLQGQVAKSFGSAINTIIDYEDRKQKAEEVYVQNTATLSFHKMAADFREKINTNQFTDDREIVPEWENNVKEWEAQNAPLFERLTPQAKVHIKGAFDLGAIDTTAEFQHAADQQQLKRTVKSHIATGKLLKESGDPNQLELYKKQTEQMQADGMLSQEQADYELSTADRDFETANVYRTITGSSQAARIKLRDDLANDKFKHLDPKVTQRAIVENNNAITVSQRNKLNALSKEADKTPLGLPNMTKAKDALDHEEITASGYQSLLNRTKKADAATDKNQSNLIASSIIDADFIKSENRDDLYSEIDVRIKSVHNLQLRNELEDKLKRKYNAAIKEMKSDVKPEVQTQLTMMQQDFSEGMAFVPMTQGKPATAGFFTGTEAEEPKHVKGGIRAIDKMDDDTFHDYFGKDAKREEVIEAARLNYSRKQQEFLTRANNASPEQLRDPEFLPNLRKKIEYSDAKTAVSNTLFRGPKNFTPEKIKAAKDFITQNLDSKEPKTQAQVKAIIKLMMQ